MARRAAPSSSDLEDTLVMAITSLKASGDEALFNLSGGMATAYQLMAEDDPEETLKLPIAGGPIKDSSLQCAVAAGVSRVQYDRKTGEEIVRLRILMGKAAEELQEKMEPGAAAAAAAAASTSSSGESSSAQMGMARRRILVDPLVCAAGCVAPTGKVTTLAEFDEWLESCRRGDEAAKGVLVDFSVSTGRRELCGALALTKARVTVDFPGWPALEAKARADYEEWFAHASATAFCDKEVDSTDAPLLRTGEPDAFAQRLHSIAMCAASVSRTLATMGDDEPRGVAVWASRVSAFIQVLRGDIADAMSVGADDKPVVTAYGSACLAWKNLFRGNFRRTVGGAPGGGLTDRTFKADSRLSLAWSGKPGVCAEDLCDRAAKRQREDPAADRGGKWPRKGASGGKWGGKKAKEAPKGAAAASSDEDATTAPTNGTKGGGSGRGQGSRKGKGQAGGAVGRN